MLIHEDDYYKNDDEIPNDEVTGEQNWDCPESIDMKTFETHLKSLKNSNNNKNKNNKNDDSNESYEITNHSIQPKYKTKISAELEKKLKSQIQAKLGDYAVNSNEDVSSDETPDAEKLNTVDATNSAAFASDSDMKGAGTSTASPKYKFVFIDGFLLYHEGSKLPEILDVKLFIKVSYEILKHRRESREGYQTKDSFWVDPPGYFDKLVYPNYAKSHAHLFKNGDLENESEILGNEKLGIDMLDIRDEKVTIEDILEWSVNVILSHV